MKALVKEDLNKHAANYSAQFAAIDNKARVATAMEKYEDFFCSKKHMKRLAKVEEIIKNFFNQYPNYYTPRTGYNRPFEAVKISDVGRILRRKTNTEKNEKLYQPLLDLGNVEIKSTNGHLIVRVFPT